MRRNSSDQTNLKKQRNLQRFFPLRKHKFGTKQTDCIMSTKIVSKHIGQLKSRLMFKTKLCQQNDFAIASAFNVDRQSPTIKSTEMCFFKI